jgi:hypothetical protein
LSKVLIVGDSFAAHNAQGWTCQLGKDFEVTNLASNGASQYRVLKHVLETDLDQFDFVIVVHTSPNRIYVEKNPYYQNSKTHPDCDLIYEDVRSRKPDVFAEHVTWWFENVFDLEQARYMHQLMCEKIKTLLLDKTTLHMTFFELGHIGNIEILHHVWKEHPGKINHLDEIGNRLVAEFVRNQLQLLQQRTL